MRRVAKLVGAALVASAWLVPARLWAEPYTPRDDAAVLERLPLAPLDAAARRQRELRAELAARPDDVARATQLAGLYIDSGRRSADPRFYGYAQSVLAPWWHEATPPVPVLVLRATIRQHDHDFAAALNDLAAALHADPTNAQAWLTQAVVQQVRGDYTAARASCEQVLQLATPLVGVICISGVDSLSGKAETSYAALVRAFERSPNADTPTRRWALTTLAEMAARRGDAARAEAHFQAALALGPRDDYLRGAYADFLLDQERPADVRTLLADALQSDALLLRLAIAEARLAAPQRDAHVQMLRDRFAAARRRGDSVHRREEARFALELLGDVPTALALARDNWAVQREGWDARLLLAAARAAGDRDAAAPVVEFLTAQHSEDVLLQRAVAELDQVPS
jgi:Tfp pilus assembly protein PilF